MHDQAGYAVRFEWGPTGAAAVVGGADGADVVAVVVDVLSFTTTVCVAVERGLTVLPYRWRDERAAAYADARAATLAVGRLEARALGAAAVSLSPAAMTAVEGVERIVLPSPNGSTIASALADSGAEVVAGCLRNRSAVAALLAEQLAAGASVAVVAAGERWPDDSLRPCAEDLWGAGAILSALSAIAAPGVTAAFSPEARLAAAAFDAVAPTLASGLRDCAGGRELVEAGFAEDVAVAAALDVAGDVPVLEGGEFSAR